LIAPVWAGVSATCSSVAGCVVTGVLAGLQAMSNTAAAKRANTNEKKRFGRDMIVSF
jgi:hypothetical protein